MSYRGYDELRRGLVLHLPFSEGVGTSVKDTSQNRYNGTLLKDNGVLPQWVEGREGRRALEFDGVGAYVRTASFAFSSAVFTLSAYVKCGLVAGDQQQIFIDGGESQTVGFIMWDRATNSDTMEVRYCDSVGEWGDALISPNFFTGYDDVFVHALVVINFTDENARFYRNGVFMREDAMQNTPVLPTVDRVKYIGRYRIAGNYFNGIIDDLRVYERILDPIEIRNLYNLRGLI